MGRPFGAWSRPRQYCIFSERAGGGAAPKAPRSRGPRRACDAGISQLQAVMEKGPIYVSHRLFKEPQE